MTASTSKLKWSISTALMIIRQPLIAPKMTEIEQKYHQFTLRKEIERSLLSDFELRQLKDDEYKRKRAQLEADGKVLSEIDQGVGILAEQQEDEWQQRAQLFRQQYMNGEKGHFYNLLVTTSAKVSTFKVLYLDVKYCNDPKSTMRCPDRKLALLVRQRYAPDYVSPWALPEFVYMPSTDDNLRKTIDRAIDTCFGVTSPIHVMGKAPHFYFSLRYPTKLRSSLSLDAVGNKVFVFHANLMSKKQIDLKSNAFADYRWVARDELSQLLMDSYKTSIIKRIQSMLHD